MSGMSREFHDLVRAIGDCKSKQEEDLIVAKEVVTLRQRLADRDTTSRMKEFVMRMMYCEMLGHRVEFGYIHAVNMTQRAALGEKRTGYLAASLFLDANSELLILLVNTIQKDLKSTNPWDVCAALSAVTRVIGGETVPAVLKPVREAFTHKDAHVRKGAVMALQRFLHKSPESVDDAASVLKRTLGDREPAVMCAGLCALTDLARADPAAYGNLVPSLASILKQVIEHRLPRDFDYHRTPAPWLQMKLLKLLAILGHANQRTSEEMYEVLRETMARADLKTTIGFALIFETVRTITAIYPQPQLLATAADFTSRFLTSENRNVKCIGVDALSAIVQVNAEFAAQHQMVVIDCLEDPDETLKWKTLDLLFRMTNFKNVEVVVDRMTWFLSATKDDHMKRDLVQKITSLAEKYAPSNSWYIQTMNFLLEKGGDLMEGEVAHNLMRLLAEGAAESEEQDNELRRFAANSYLVLLPKQNTPDLLVQVGSWTLGEYAYLLAPDTEPLTVVNLLCDLMDRSFDADAASKCFLVSAITKLMPLCGTSGNSAARDVISRFRNAKNPNLQQRCLELEALLQRPDIMSKVLPLDASCEDVEVDPALPFLDAIVAASLRGGGRPYMSLRERQAAFGSASVGPGGPQGNLRFEAYQAPPPPSAVPAQPRPDPALFAGMTTSDAPAAQAAGGGGGQKWGSGGYSGEQSGGGGQQGGGQRGAAAKVPEVSEEKKKLAAGLFAGLTTASPPPAASTPAQPKPPAPAPAPQRPAPPPSAQTDLVDLLGGPAPFPATTVPAPSPAPPAGSSSIYRSAVPPATGGGLGDLDALLGMPSAPAPAPARTAPSQPSDGLGIFGSSPPPPSAGLMGHGGGGGGAGGGMGNIFDDLLSAPSASPQLPSAAPLAMTGAPLPPGFPLPGSVTALVGAVRPTVVWKRPDGFEIAAANAKAPGGAALLLLQLRNGSSGPVTDVRVQYFVPSGATASYGGDPPPSVSYDGQVSLPPLPFNGSASHVLTLTTAPGPIDPNFQLRIRIAQGARQDEAAVPVAFFGLQSLLSPAVLSEQQFGQNWGGHAAEKRLEVAGSAVETAEQYQTALEGRVNLKVVKVIGKEVISAGQHPTLGLCLVHAKLGTGKLNFIVRSQDPAYTAGLSAALSTLLA